MPQVPTSELVAQAKLLPVQERSRLLANLKEAELHKYLKELLSRMEPNYTIEITHGADELGKDLVILKKDKFEHQVIGVVVKVGNIRGTTVGEVDEISKRTGRVLGGASKRKLHEVESQIKQALAHPAQMKSVLAKLTVDECFVVIDGSVSNSARERLENEVAGAKVHVFDLDWLVEHFTNFYPQVYFDPQAIDYLHDTIHNLEIQHCHARRGKALSDYFIDPIVAKSELPSKNASEEESVHAMLSTEKLSYTELQPTIDTKRRVLLIGEPGTGKTNTLAKLACMRLPRRRPAA